VISQDDIQAREARLLLDLCRGIPVPAKHANDYLRLERLVQPPGVEAAWQDHRKAEHPKTFREASTLVQRLIATHRDLLSTSITRKMPLRSARVVSKQMHSHWPIRVSCSRCSGTASHLAVLSPLRQLTGAWVHGLVSGVSVNLISTHPPDGASSRTSLRPRPRSHPNEACCVVFFVRRFRTAHFSADGRSEVCQPV
jgi:hypothetical protein